MVISPAPGAALVRGELDFSQKDRMVFRSFHAEVDGGALDIDGMVDLNGPCNLTSDARNVRIERVGHWVSKDFPLSGIGNYHLILQGTFDKPLLNASFSLSGGKFYGLSYDLFDGTLIARDNLLRIGSPETPLTLSRSGSYAFTLFGTMPFALCLRLNDSPATALSLARAAVSRSGTWSCRSPDILAAVRALA